MIVCVKCAVPMRCDKNEVGALFGASHVYPGDRFRCPSCGAEILKTNEAPIYDPALNAQREYVKMNEVQG